MITTKKYIITVVLLVVLAIGSFFGGLKLGGKGYKYSGSDFKIINQNNAPANVDYSLLWQALDVLNQKYINKPIDQQKVLFGAVSGAVAALGDPYTTFFDPDSLKDFQTELSGSFDGIGAEVDADKDGNIVIIAPIDGAPAQKAGLQAGDIILKIDGTSTSGQSVDDVVSKIRGQRGTVVDLGIYRPATQAQIDIKITRAEINIKSVKWGVKTENGKKIEDITISTFGDDTIDLFKQAAADAIANKVSGIVLDLRGDPGGYLDDAVAVSSYWVNPGDLIVSEAHSDGTTIPYKAAGGNTLGNIPTIVLIDGGSASASEITSGALHDHGKAQLLGVKSFGKGSVQQLIDLPQNTAIKVTIAKWLTPNGININKNGLEPDIKVDRTADQVQANQDPQMDKALQLLSK